MRILYFAWLRERIGAAEEVVQPPGDLASVAALVAWLRHQSPGHAAAFADPALVRCAIDQEFVGADAALAGATEIAFFPPVTGG